MDRFEIIQGDSVEAAITLEGDNVYEVTGIQFICDALGVTYDLGQTLEPLIWVLKINSEDTKNMRVGVFKYSLVATYIGGWRKTIVYGQDVEVLLKDYE